MIKKIISCLFVCNLVACSAQPLISYAAGIKTTISIETVTQQQNISLTPSNNMVLQVQFGQILMLDCNKHSLMGKLQIASSNANIKAYYQLDNINRGPSTMQACFDQALTEHFLPIPDELKLTLNAGDTLAFTLPQGSTLRYRQWGSSDEFSYVPEKSINAKLDTK